MRRDVARLVKFGLGGHAILYDNGILSGYDRPETFRPEARHGLTAGVYVLDLREAPEIVGTSISGPMCQPSLPAGTMRPLFSPVQPYDAAGCDCLTYVALDVYVDLWRAAGARVGVWDGSRISWEGEADC